LVIIPHVAAIGCYALLFAIPNLCALFKLHKYSFWLGAIMMGLAITFNLYLIATAMLVTGMPRSYEVSYLRQFLGEFFLCFMPIINFCAIFRVDRLCSRLDLLIRQKLARKQPVR